MPTPQSSSLGRWSARSSTPSGHRALSARDSLSGARGSAARFAGSSAEATVEMMMMRSLAFGCASRGQHRNEGTKAEGCSSADLRRARVRLQRLNGLMAAAATPANADAPDDPMDDLSASRHQRDIGRGAAGEVCRSRWRNHWRTLRLDRQKSPQVQDLRDRLHKLPKPRAQVRFLSGASSRLFFRRRPRERRRRDLSAHRTRSPPSAPLRLLARRPSPERHNDQEARCRGRDEDEDGVPEEAREPTRLRLLTSGSASWSSIPRRVSGTRGGAATTLRRLHRANA